ncbi:MAG: hypothetical protein ACD_62C00392G0002 [uncultured bacterium]|nr:MAG: hypothetical protein ACD_62C00392G0002 [uncultured bacterium]
MTTINNGQSIPPHYGSIINLPELIADIEKNGNCHDIDEEGNLTSRGDLTLNESKCFFNFFGSTPGITPSDIQAIKTYSSSELAHRLSYKKLHELARYISTVFPHELPYSDDEFYVSSPTRSQPRLIPQTVPLIHQSPVTISQRDEAGYSDGEILESDFDFSLEFTIHHDVSQTIPDDHHSVDEGELIVARMGLCQAGKQASDIGQDALQVMLQYLFALRQNKPYLYGSAFYANSEKVSVSCEFLNDSLSAFQVMND